jgi:hypothetical protein
VLQEEEEVAREDKSSTHATMTSQPSKHTISK